MRIGCIIQARLDNFRLQRKVLADIGGWPMLKHVVLRLARMPEAIPLFPAVPPGDLPEMVEAMPTIGFYSGDCHPEDVLKRHLLVAQAQGLDAVMRVTSDCPLIDPGACGEVLKIYQSGHYDYVANDLIQTYPDGLGCEIMSTKALRWADATLRPLDPEKLNHESSRDRIHVSPWIIRKVKEGLFSGTNIVCPIPKIAELKFSVDTQQDLDRVRAIDAAKPADYSVGATVDAYNRAQYIQNPAQ